MSRYIPKKGDFVIVSFDLQARWDQQGGPAYQDSLGFIIAPGAIRPEMSRQVL